MKAGTMFYNKTLNTINIVLGYCEYNQQVIMLKVLGPDNIIYQVGYDSTDLKESDNWELIFNLE